MKKKLIITLSCMLAACILTAAGVEKPNENAISYDELAKYYYGFEIFNGELFWKSMWPAAQADNLVWKADNAQVKDGQLILKIDKEGNGYSGGEVYTGKKYGFGTYQVSMKPIKNSGVVSAFFNYAQDKDGGTEIDIEFLGYDTTKVQFNYYTSGVGGHEYLYDLGFDASKAFHTYAFKWAKDSIKWYVDGELVHESVKNIPQKKAQIFMDAWPSKDAHWAGKYDGATPLYAYYRSWSYTSEAPDDEENDDIRNEGGSDNSGDGGVGNDEPGDEVPENENVEEQPQEEPEPEGSIPENTTVYEENIPENTPESIIQSNDATDNNLNQESIQPVKAVTKDDITCVLDQSGKATVTRITSKKRVYLDTITIDGITYPIVSIGDNACKNNKSIKYVRIGTNVTNIGKKAFKGCKKLKEVKIKTNKSIDIGKEAFKKINKDAVIKVKGIKGHTKKKLIKTIRKQTNAVVK